MGVKDLWKILNKAKKKVDLKELWGKTLAVDLSCWVCRFSSVKANSLKNLFYRVLHLYSAGVSLVFVIEGSPSPMKAKVVGKSGRENFVRKLEECCALLETLGIPCLHAAGEAEAYCALLDSSGAVHGVLTDDNDAFLYGAQTVYCDLCASEKEVSMSVCSMFKVQQTIGLNRVDLVALGLLLGSDYCPGGVPGVGKKLALQLVRAWKRKDSSDLLERFREWNSPQFQEGALISNTEKYIKSKSKEIDGFPNEDIIREYLSPGCELPMDLSAKLQWRAPDITRFQEFAVGTLLWSREYCLQKCYSLLSEWLKRHPDAQEIVTARVLKMRESSAVVHSLVEWKVDKHVFKTEDFMTFTSWEESSQIRSYFKARLITHGLEAADELGKRDPPSRDEDVENEEEELFFSSMRKRRRKHFRL